MRPKANRDSISPDSHPQSPRRAAANGPSAGRRRLEARFAPLGPAHGADNDDLGQPLHPAAHRRTPPTNFTLLLRAGGLVVVIAAVLLILRPVSKIALTASPDLDPARIHIISSAGDSEPAAQQARSKRQARVPPAIVKPAAAHIAGHPPAAAAIAAPPSAAMAFAPDEAAPSSPALIATVRAVPVFAPSAAGDARRPAPATAAPLPNATALAIAAPAVPLPRPAAIAEAGPREESAAPAAPTPGSARQGDALVRDARRLLARGRLAEGRDKLKQAVAAGNGHAANVLAKTYDPAVLKSWHVKGAQVDPAEARRWYEKAKELGSPAAKVALDHMN